jgi:UDP-N-acetylmuramoyl-L-alanyl-D-glutamate--2,6-diaminopimelate ligase
MAIRLAQPLDTVLIAGKGHEDCQIIGKKKFPFDDRIEAKKALEEE